MTVLDVQFNDIFLFNFEPRHKQTKVLKIQNLGEEKFSRVILFNVENALIGCWLLIWLTNDTVKQFDQHRKIVSEVWFQ